MIRITSGPETSTCAIAGDNVDPETKTVYLAEPLPFLLLYWTANIGAECEHLFYEDV